MPDIEDAGVCLDRQQQFRFGRGLSVTDFTASEWCQQQVAFNLSAKLPKEVTETEAMAAGKKQHAELEAETAVEVEVETESREDMWALRLLATITALRQLQSEGLTREVFCFGLLQGCWVRGIIDQIELDAESRAIVVEHKTRFNPSLPSHAQKRTAKLQVLLYCALFGSLAASARQHLPAMLQQLRLDGCAPLGAGVAAQAPILAASHYVRYLWQGDGSELGQEHVHLDGFAVQQALRRHLLFWSGNKPPEMVPITEDWKCRQCLFAAKCPTGQGLARRPS
ncbi:hypothetical protein WJX84_003384 [Apatococcus fuscideae]|uniref:PD-(D/E)XK endonuclease-like domain-containing protein n=1 Tax=Apatococcus fuscideae TaxID=2026836 RepID=A0AAW1TDT1_9CHLO